jgi:hypothetical protein
MYLVSVPLKHNTFCAQAVICGRYTDHMFPLPVFHLVRASVVKLHPKGIYYLFCVLLVRAFADHIHAFVRVCVCVSMCGLRSRQCGKLNSDLTCRY